MDITDYVEKEKGLKEAKEKVKEYEKALKEDRRKRLREKFQKINIFHKLNPWIVWNSVLTVLVLVLFIGAYSSNPNPTVSEENKFGGFLANIFGFLSNENKVTDGNSGIVDGSVVSNNEGSNTSNNVSSDSTIDTEPNTNASDITVTTPESEEVELVDFDLSAQYNGQGFQVLNTTSDSLTYYLIVNNKEGYKIRCEGYASKNNQDTLNIVTVNPYDQRSLITMISSSLGYLVTIKHEFTCYEEDGTIDDGTTKKIIVKVYFS